jgi:Tfp pilus assembly protein PilF
MGGGNGQDQAQALRDRALGLLRQGQLRQATGHLTQALAISRELGDRRTEAAALANLGVAQADQGDHKRAGESLRASLVIYEELGAPEAERLRQMLKQLGRPDRRAWPFGRRRG